jgi:hypothetical protein
MDTGTNKLVSIFSVHASHTRHRAAQGGCEVSELNPRQHFLLDEACKPFRAAFGNCPYLVGTAAVRNGERNYRDVDVRLIMWDEEYDKLAEAIGEPGITFLGVVIGDYLARRTDLPIDFQVQRETEANSKHHGKPRNALGMLDLKHWRGDGRPYESDLASKEKTK